MRRGEHPFLVGLISIVAVIGLGALLIAFGEMDWLLRPSYAIQLDTNHAAGLRRGSPVTLNGVPVGRIGDIALQDDAEFPVRVVTLVDRGTLVPADVSIRVDQALIGGASVLSMAGGGLTGSMCATDGTARLTSTYRTVLQQASDALMERFEPLMDAMGAFNRISEASVTLAEDLGALLKPQEAGDLADGGAANLHTVVATLNRRLEDAGRTIELAESWLSDEAIRSGVRDTVTRAGTVMDEAGDALERYTRLADQLEARSATVVARLTEVSDQAGATLEEVRRVAATATTGDGTVSRLLNDPDLYNSLEDASVRLEKTLAQLQLLIEKIKAEGLPVDF